MIVPDQGKTKRIFLRESETKRKILRTRYAMRSGIKRFVKKIKLDRWINAITGKDSANPTVVPNSIESVSFLKKRQ